MKLTPDQAVQVWTAAYAVALAEVLKKTDYPGNASAYAKGHADFAMRVAINSFALINITPTTSLGS